MAVEPPSLWGTIAAERLRLNPFRVLGLGVDASAAQVRRAAEKAAAAGRLGSVFAPRGPLALPVVPDPAAVREAAHQLRDPAARLLAEAFWLHPDPGPEPARWSLDDGQDIDDLCRAWDGLWEDDDEKRGVAALHNLAVVELVRALDAEAARGPGRGESAGPGAATGAASPQDWTDTLDTWVSLLDEDESVADLRRRAVVLKLASTASEPTERLRTMLARAVLDPLVQSVCRELDRGGVPHQDLIERLVEVDLPGDVGEHAVHRIVQHTDERIRSVADPGWQRVLKDETAAQEVAHELIETLGGLLALLRTARAAGVDQGLAQRAADDVATTLAACATRMAALHPERRREALRIARHGADLAIGADAIGQTAWALTSLREPGRCTECARPLPAPHGTMIIPMWRPTEPGSQVVERQDFHVPWCRRCSLRVWVQLLLASIRVIGALAWIPLLVIWGFRQETGWLEWAAAAFAARSFSIWWIKRRWQRVFRQLRTQPAMRAALDQGWRGSPGFEFDA